MDEITKLHPSATYNLKFTYLAGWEWWVESNFHSVMHTLHAQIKPLDLHHMDPGEEGSCSNQLTCWVLAWSLACACSDSSFGSALLMVLDICTWSSLQPRGVILLTSYCFVYLSAQAVPGHSLLTFSISKASYWWGGDCYRPLVSHPKCVSKCEFSNSCLMKFLFCFFVFQFMPD